MYEPTLKMRIPKYLLLTHDDKCRSYVRYKENIDQLFDYIEPNKITTVYVRNGSCGEHWEYLCDLSKEVYSM